MWNLILVHLKTVLVSVQDKCTICAKHTVGTEIVLDTPNGTLSYEAQVEARFSPIGDSGKLDEDNCTVCAERTTGSEIVSDAPDGTPR
jgi:hypothetical protein